MIQGQLALAFAAGMVATVNPCGFAMLPAYLSFFLGLEGRDESVSADRAIGRALGVSAVLTLGFVAVFGIVGFTITNFSIVISDRLPWVTLVIGIGLVGLGIAMLMGFEPVVRIPKLAKGGGSQDLPSMFLFGVSYAVASLSCTIGPFLAVTSSTFRNANLISGVTVFVLYGLGMGLVLTALTLTLALAKSGVARNLRRFLPYVNRVSTLLLIVAGVYVSWFAYVEIRIFRGDRINRGPVELVERIQADVTNWINDAGTTRIGVILGAVVSATVVSILLRRRLRHDESPQLTSTSD